MESGNGINSRQVASWILGGDSGEEVMLRVKQRSSCYHFLSKVLRVRFSVKNISATYGCAHNDVQTPGPRCGEVC